MDKKPIYVFARWQVKKGRLEDVLTTLSEVSRETRREAGNLFYKAHQSLSDTHTIILFEGYADETALEEHRNSTHYQKLVIGKIIPDLENREVALMSGLDADPAGSVIK